MKSTEHTTKAAGIDISKAKLDVAVHGAPTAFVAANALAGWQDTAKRLQRAGVTRVGMEATGGYERGVARCLRTAGFEVVLLQPLQVKAFAQARLQRAKTDPLDAALIAAFTQLVEQPPRTPPSPEQDALADHLTYLEQIEDDIARLKTRLEHTACPRIRRTTEADIKRLAARRAAELGRLDAQARTCPERRRRLDLLLSIPSIGLRTALALLLRLPELGETSREQAAALAGLAPHARQSGKQAGETHVGGGRERLRRSLFMAAFAGAHRWNPALKAFHQRLTGRGMAPRSALVACARKLLAFAVAVVQRGTPWQDQPANASA